MVRWKYMGRSVICIYSASTFVQSKQIKKERLGSQHRVSGHPGHSEQLGAGVLFSYMITLLDLGCEPTTLQTLTPMPIVLSNSPVGEWLTWTRFFKQM